MPAIASGLGVFRHRNYRLFYGGQAVSLVGTWMQQVAQAWLLLQLTNDPFVLGLASVCAFGPVLVFGLFGGLIADALPKRRTLIAVQVAQMSLALILFALVITNTVQVWHVLALAVLLGLTNAVDMPVRQSFVVEMTGRDEVGTAVALNSALFNATRVVGPAIGGLAIGAFGMAQAFLLNGLSFLAPVTTYSLMRDQELFSPPALARAHSAAEVREQLAEGLRYVRRTDMVLMLVMIVGIVSTLGMNFGVMIPAFARGVLRTDATGFGFIMAATGLGSMTSALGIAFSGKSRPAIVWRGALLLGLALIGAAVVPSFWLALPVMFVLGFGAIGMAATANTVIQTAVPDGLRGRVISVYTTVFVGSTPVGGLVSGWLMSNVGIPDTLAISGIGCVLASVAAAAWLRRIERAQAREPDLDGATAAQASSR